MEVFKALDHSFINQLKKWILFTFFHAFAFVNDFDSIQTCTLTTGKVFSLIQESSKLVNPSKSSFQKFNIKNTFYIIHEVRQSKKKSFKNRGKFKFFVWQFF